MHCRNRAAGLVDLKRPCPTLVQPSVLPLAYCAAADSFRSTLWLQVYLDAAADHILGLKWHMRSHFQLHVAPSQPEHAIQAEGCSVAAVQLILADLLPGYEEAAEPSLAASLADPLAQNDW